MAAWMKHGNAARPLAYAREDSTLAAAALHETFQVLKALGHGTVPASQRFLAIARVFVLAFLLRLLANSRMGQLMGAWHAQQASGEMPALAADLRAAVIRSGVPGPALRKVLDVAD
jgi:hypothetical protein